MTTKQKIALSCLTLILTSCLILSVLSIFIAGLMLAQTSEPKTPSPLSSIIQFNHPFLLCCPLITEGSEQDVSLAYTLNKPS